MAGRRTTRVQALTGIGVDRVGALAAQKEESSITAPKGREQRDKPLRMENLDTDVPPHPIALEATAKAISSKEDNSYLPFIGQLGLRKAAAAHVSRMTGGVTQYSGEENCVITAGGLSGVLNTLFATVEPGEGVLLTDPTYIGLINRVKLVGAIPVLLPLEFRPGKPWRFPREKLRQFIESAQETDGIRITALLLSSPALPSGAYLDADDWHAVAEVCISRDLLLIYDAAFERLLFDGRPVVHPAFFPGMAERTITVGSASKELRLIGWRVGWVVGPTWAIADIRLVGMANVVVPVGIAQKAAQAALEQSAPDCLMFTRELQARRDLLMEELQGLPVGVPAGGWSFVLRVENGREASRALMEEGIYVTPMDGWGEAHGEGFIRFVFSNEPCHRLEGIGVKVRAALNHPHPESTPTL
ncbi:aspartate/tyrosine/aromatic aminotransferase [Neohortaea acidophila]|uniref:Aspartate/tyrosine/aromatic aminotransferase n=1 Tax=Neohortaea acidophila TaxID=245834 RepID=A0A6A6PF97_9PEZI|nr:aspartate/tyrosine/aromatic aminotransferase [Neohortaea acidophila]KAF2478659.1 aspartate/tyrosine/aromatic aminotransferase [Neohortaea acidophila]